jgi:hypothetical protein
MGNQIHLVEGYPPWAPGPDADLVAEYHRHDIPLIGLISQANVPYLFYCLYGQLDAENLWAYVTLTEREVEALEGSESPEQFRERVEAFLLQERAWVALARHGRIVEIAPIYGRQGSVRDLVNAAADAISAALERTGRDLRQSVSR